MVSFIRFYLAETTSAWSPQGRGQAQQKPNLAKAPAWKLTGKKTQHRGNEKKPSIVETRTAKINAAESSRDSVSDSRRPPVKVGGPHTYGWKDICLTKSWFFYSHLFLVSSNPRWTGKRQWVQLRYSGRGSSSVCPKGSTICWAPVAVTQERGILLSLIFFLPRIRPMKTEHRSDI